MNKEEARKIFEQVQANTKRLDACPKPHDFVDDPEDVRKVWKRKVCTNCGGKVDCIAAHWYERGMKDAGR